MKYLYVKPVFLWLFAVAVMFLGACTSEVPGTSETAEAISFDVPQTRAAVESTDDMDAFSVWGWYDADTTTPFAVFDNTKVEKNANGWNYTDYVRYWSPGKMYDFYAVYPFGVSNVDVNSQNGTITITDFDCSATGENAVDLMTAFATGDGDNPQTVNMQFGHELARVSIVVRSRFADAELSEVRLYGMAVKGGLSVSEAHSSWDVKVEDLVTYESTPYRLSSYSIEMGKDFNLWGDLLVIPQAVDGLKLKVQYTIGGQSQESEVSLVTPTLKEWVASQSYRYILTLESDGILFENLTADAWGETSSGGSIIIP